MQPTLANHPGSPTTPTLGRTAPVVPAKVSDAAWCAGTHWGDRVYDRTTFAVPSFPRRSRMRRGVPEPTGVTGPMTGSHSPSRRSRAPPVVPAPLPSFPATSCHSREGGNPVQPTLANHPRSPTTPTPGRTAPVVPAPFPSFPATSCHSREGGNPAQPTLANHPGSPTTPTLGRTAPVVPAKVSDAAWCAGTHWGDRSYDRDHIRPPVVPASPLVVPAKAGTQCNQHSQPPEIANTPTLGRAPPVTLAKVSNVPWRLGTQSAVSPGL